MALLTALLLPAVAGAADGPWIRIKGDQEVRVNTTTYRLRDIAEVGGCAAALCAALKALEIGVAPRPGRLTTVAVADIRARVARAGLAASPSLHWSGPKTVAVRRAGVEHGPQFIAAAATAELQAWLAARGHQAVLRVTTELKAVMLPVGAVSAQPRLSPAARLAKRMPVWVDIAVAGYVVRTELVWFSVSVAAPVLAAAQPLHRGQALAEHQVVDVVADIAALRGAPLGRSGLAGVRLSRDFAQGAVLTADAVEPMPAVCKGEPLLVEVRAGGVTLTVEAVAAADGAIGDRVDVESASSGERYEVRVVGKGRAQVD